MDALKTLEGFDPETKQEVVNVLNRMRDAILAGAVQIEDPEQLRRYLDGVHELAGNIDGRMHDDPRLVDRTVTRIRQAAMDIGFGKFITRAGKQENPED